MPRSPSVSVMASGCVVFVLASSSALALLFRAPGVDDANPPASPAPASSVRTVVLDTSPVADGGYGDRVLAVEVGRDARSPFCRIAVRITHANPSFDAALAWAARADADGLDTRGAVDPVILCARGPFGTPPAVVVRFTYRATGDPASPREPAPSGAPDAIDSQMRLCRQLAETFLPLRDAETRAGSPGGTWIELRVVPVGVRPSLLEFWQFRIVR